MRLSLQSSRTTHWGGPVLYYAPLTRSVVFFFAGKYTVDIPGKIHCVLRQVWLLGRKPLQHESNWKRTARKTHTKKDTTNTEGRSQWSSAMCNLFLEFDLCKTFVTMFNVTTLCRACCRFITSQKKCHFIIWERINDGQSMWSKCEKLG